MEVIPATVPILRLTDRVSRLQVDINVESTVGVRNTHLLHSYAQCESRGLIKNLKNGILYWNEKAHDIKPIYKFRFYLPDKK